MEGAHFGLPPCVFTDPAQRTFLLFDKDILRHEEEGKNVANSFLDLTV